MVGAAVIATAAVVTLATGGVGAGLAGYIAAGALKGAVFGALTGAATGTVSGAISHRITSGSWQGAGKKALEGAASGFMWGSIAGAATGGGGRALQSIRSTKIKTHSVPKTGKRLSSKVRVKNGVVRQRRFYNIKGKARFDIDYDKKARPGHTLIHGHRIRKTRIKTFHRDTKPINALWRRKG